MRMLYLYEHNWTVVTMISPKSLDEIYQNDIISMIIINCDIVCVCEDGIFFCRMREFFEWLGKNRMEFMGKDFKCFIFDHLNLFNC